MEKIETIEEFYQRKFNWIPDNIRSEIGHFNVFQHEPIEPGKIKPLPYKRRDFYKIMLVVGDINMNYADRVVSIKKQALFFSNPQIPYNCENLEKINSVINITGKSVIKGTNAIFDPSVLLCCKVSEITSVRRGPGDNPADNPNMAPMVK